MGGGVAGQQGSAASLAPASRSARSSSATAAGSSGRAWPTVHWAARVLSTGLTRRRWVMS